MDNYRAEQAREDAVKDEWAALREEEATIRTHAQELYGALRYVWAMHVVEKHQAYPNACACPDWKDAVRVMRKVAP